MLANWRVVAHLSGHLSTVAGVLRATMSTYSRLLDPFWNWMDSTQGERQFSDKGDSGRSAIFWRNEAQRRAALASRQEIEKSGALGGRPIVTLVVKAGPFWPAEEYHQDFYRNDPDRYHSYREGCGR